MKDLYENLVGKIPDGVGMTDYPEKSNSATKSSENIKNKLNSVPE